MYVHLHDGNAGSPAVESCFNWRKERLIHTVNLLSNIEKKPSSMLEHPPSAHRGVKDEAGDGSKTRGEKEEAVTHKGAAVGGLAASVREQAVLRYRCSI